jgi:chromosome segregation ATPase
MTDQELSQHFQQLTIGLQQINERLDHVDRRFEQIDRRFEQIDRRLDELERRLEQRFEETIEFARGIETSLLKEFRKWAISFESRHKANEILIGGFNERLIALEERVGDIERNDGGQRR